MQERSSFFISKEFLEHSIPSFFFLRTLRYNSHGRSSVSFQDHPQGDDMPPFRQNPFPFFPFFATTTAPYRSSTSSCNSDSIVHVVNVINPCIKAMDSSSWMQCKTDDSLFTLVYQQRWEELVVKVQSLAPFERGSLKETCKVRYPNDGVPLQSSIFHVICAYETVEVSVVETFLREIGQDLAFCVDENGRTPVHVAVSFSCRPEIIRTLLRASPRTAQLSDGNLFRPIDIVCQKIIMKEERVKYKSTNSNIIHNNCTTQANPSGDDGINRLWECAHLLAIALDNISPAKDWEQPMLHACLRASAGDFPYALLERAMKRFKGQFQLADRFGNFPLHVVALLPPDMDASKYFVREVAERYFLAAKLRNSHRNIPLDLAIESGLRGWFTGIADLLEIYPAPDNFPLELLPHILAKAATHGRKTIVFEMLMARPNLFT